MQDRQQTVNEHIYFLGTGVRMIELGKKQKLLVVKTVDFGIYLGEDRNAPQNERVLLPSKQVPEGTKVGDEIEVFIYKDSQDRLIATTREPMLQVGQTAVLKVKQVTRIGAFLDWGLEKDLFMPFKEQTKHVQEGDECLVALYIDKSSRLAATMRVYDYLTNAQNYVKDSAVSGTVIEINPDYGVYVAIDNKYFGMIPKNEVFGKINIGDIIYGRVSKVREDGKLTISLKQKAYIQMDEDSSIIYEAIKNNGGSLPFTDKASPEIIKEHFQMSKNAFKRAVGRLLKEGKIVINETSINMK